MITEKGTLPVGVEFAGKVHKNFEIRPQKMRDSVEVQEIPRAAKNETFAGVCLVAKQIISLGEIPEKDITPELIMDMCPADFMALTEAGEALDNRLLGFSEKEAASPAKDPGPDEAGVQQA